MVKTNTKSIVEMLFIFMIAVAVIAAAVFAEEDTTKEKYAAKDAIEEEYEEGDEVEAEETTADGFAASEEMKAASQKELLSANYLCVDALRCKQLDEVWAERISAYVNGQRSHQVWDVQTSQKQWKSFQEVYFPKPSAAALESKFGQSAYVTFPGTGKCFDMARSNSAEQAAAQLKEVEFQGKKIKVHKIIAPLIVTIDKEITAANTGYNFKIISTGRWRCVSSPIIKIVDLVTCQTSKGRIARSKHSYGIALDINPAENPYCVEGSDGKQYKNGKVCNPTIPQKIVDIFKKNDFRWGGDWDNAKDYMHFDWKGTIGDFNGDGVVESCGSSSPILTGASPASS